MSSNLMSTVAVVNASNASAEASRAAAAAKAAQNAAEESLETKARFVVLPMVKLEKIPTGEKYFFGFFNVTKTKLAGVERVISIKTTDVANLETTTDDYNNTYTLVNLEGRSEIEDEEGDELTSFGVPLSISDVTAILNGQSVYNG